MGSVEHASPLQRRRMKLPLLAGWIERRVVIHYRLDPDTLAPQLPAPLRPRMVRGHAIAGICLVRLRQVRPRPLPALVGMGSEFAVHLLAVTWDSPDGPCDGVHVARRDSDSRFGGLVRGRIFPRLQRPARFQVREWEEGLSVSVTSRDNGTRVAMRAVRAAMLPDSSRFASIGEAADFFGPGARGITARGAAPIEPPEMRTIGWHVEALRPDLLESSYFEDPARFPEGTATFDSALLMRSVPVRTQLVRPAMRAEPRLSPT